MVMCDSFKVRWDGWVIIVLSILHVFNLITATATDQFSIIFWLLLFLLLLGIFDVRVDQTTYSTVQVNGVTIVTIILFTTAQGCRCGSWSYPTNISLHRMINNTIQQERAYTKRLL